MTKPRIQTMSSWRESQTEQQIASIEKRIRACMFEEPGADNIEGHNRWKLRLLGLQQDKLRALAEHTRLLERRIVGGQR